MPEETRRKETRPEETRRLMRLLLGELPPEEARSLERRLAEEPALRARYERLRASWESLELEPVREVPEGFRDDVVAAARRLAAGELSWSVAPGWARAGAALALAAGLVLGVSFGRLAAPSVDGETLQEAALLDAYLTAELGSELSLAEAYWLELETGGEELLADEETP